MADSTIPYEEREVLVSVLANEIGHSMYGTRKISSNVFQLLKNSARACLDALEENYVLEEKENGG